jgi:hypothetical protein
MSTAKRRVHIKRALTITALCLAGVVALLLVLLALLPTLVSSQAVQGRVQKTLSTSMKRQVGWSKLVMTWSDGLTLSGLKLGDGPAPLLKTDIDQLVIAPGFGRGSDGRFGIDLAVTIQNIRAELAPGPVKPPPPPSGKDPLTQLAETIQKLQGLDFGLPVDVRVRIDVAPLNLTYKAPAPAKQLSLHDFSFRLAMPSLVSKPVSAEIKGGVTVDGRDMGHVSLTAGISDLVTKAQRIHLAAALFAVQADAPGTSLSLGGGLSHADGFTARWKLDLPKLLAVAHPFVPATAPELAGAVELLLRAKADEKRDLHATLTIDGAALAASGGSLKAKRVGPLDVKLSQQIATDHVRQKVEFPGGSFAIPQLIDAAWSATVSQPTVPGRALDASFGPLRLDLARALAVAAPFLPPDTPVKELAGELSLHSLSLRLNGPANNGDLAVAGFGLTLPHVRVALKKGELTADDISLMLDKVACPLTARMPSKVLADLRWGIRRAALSGAQALLVQGARGTISADVSDLNLKSSSPRKVAASVTLNQSFDLDRAASGTKFTIEKVHQQLRLLARATESGEILASLPEFTIAAASLGGVQAGKRFGPLPLSASLTADDVRFPADKNGKPAIKHAAARISAGDFLLLTADAALSAVASSNGTIRVDLGRALPFAAAFAPAGLKAGGVVTAVWDLALPMTDKAPAADKHPLRSAKSGLARLDKLDMGIKLDTVSLVLPSGKGAIRVTGLKTSPDIRVVSSKKGNSLRLQGGMQFSGLSGLPGNAGKMASQHGSFLLNGALSDWSSFQLSEEFRIDPLAVAHEAELNVSRIDTLLDEKQPFSTATLVKRLDATLLASFDAAFSHDLKPLLPGIDLAGRAASSLRVDLSAGKELALRCSLKTDDFGVKLANGTSVEGMRSDIAINRVYALAQTQTERWTPLSNSLVRPSAVSADNPGAAEIVGRINDDLRGDVNGSRSFSIRRITTKANGVPLELTALEGDLLFTQEKTGLSFFQGDLLGGTILARAVFDLKPEVPVIATGSSFSNLDISKLLPKDARGRAMDQDAEITGEMSLAAPLTAEQRELFEQLRLVANVRKIGANTIERALFSLDPYERNEQVVAQRKMLKLGGLKGLRANAVDGAFSMEGEAWIKGITVELPKVERLRISELPLRQELAKNRKGIAALRGVLDMVRADTLVIGPKGEVSLKRRMYEK